MDLGPAAVPQPPRRSNPSAVLDVLRSGGPATATDLVERTGLSRPTVHTVCADLMELGWVDELDPVRPPGEGRPGRSARRYAFRSDAAFVLAIDIGANKVSALVADLRGVTVAEAVRTFRDPLVDADERLATVRDVIETLLVDAAVDASHVVAAGVGVPGPVDRSRGATSVRESFLPGLAGVDLREVLAVKDTWAVEVENDCNLAALGEQWRGVAADAADVIVMLAGERLGAGIMMDGRLVRGRDGGAGELSYLFLVDGVGNTDGIAMVARHLGQRAAANGWHPPGDGSIGAETVLAAAANGDAQALAIVDALGDRFARVVATLDTLFDPDLLVFGGAVAAAGEVFLPAIRRHLPAALDLLAAQPATTPPRIEASSLGDHVVVTGALRLALEVADARLLGGHDEPIRPAPRGHEAD